MKRLRPFENLVLDNYEYNPEEQVLNHLLNLLQISDGPGSQFLEFGAVDGKFSSNCAPLAERSWTGVFIEGSEMLFEILKSNYGDNNLIQCINSMVSPNRSSGQDLDSLLAITSLRKDFEVCSIDIDSFDLEVWYNLAQYEPKVVIIEINGSIPLGIHNWCGYSAEDGNSFSSTLQVGLKKGYTLACAPGNLYFVRNDLSSLLNLNPIFIDHPELLFRQIKPEWEPRGLLNLAFKVKNLFRLLAQPEFRKKNRARQEKEKKNRDVSDRFAI
jgi:hypothetical protein